MKKQLFSLIGFLSMIAFFIGITPTSWGAVYQPELPDELK